MTWLYLNVQHWHLLINVQCLHCHPWTLAIKSSRHMKWNKFGLMGHLEGLTNPFYEKYYVCQEHTQTDIREVSQTAGVKQTLSHGGLYAIMSNYAATMVMGNAGKASIEMGPSPPCCSLTFPFHVPGE